MVNHNQKKYKAPSLTHTIFPIFRFTPLLLNPLLPPSEWHRRETGSRRLWVTCSLLFLPLTLLLCSCSIGLSYRLQVFWDLLICCSGGSSMGYSGICSQSFFMGCKGITAFLSGTLVPFLSPPPPSCVILLPAELSPTFHS